MIVCKGKMAAELDTDVQVKGFCNALALTFAFALAKRALALGYPGIFRERGWQQERKTSTATCQQ